CHQPGPHGGAVHGAHDGLVAVDHVVDQIAGFLPHPGAHLEVGGHVLHQCQIAAARKAQAAAAQHRAAHAVVAPHIAPDFAELPVPFVTGGGQLAVATGAISPHLDVEHAGGAVHTGAAPGDGEGLVAAVVDRCHACLLWIS